MHDCKGGSEFDQKDLHVEMVMGVRVRVPKILTMLPTWNFDQNLFDFWNSLNLFLVPQNVQQSSFPESDVWETGEFIGYSFVIAGLDWWNLSKSIKKDGSCFSSNA